jgi:hypothetical protein
MPSGTLYPAALARTDVSENVLPPSSKLLKLKLFQSCITVETPLLGFSIDGYYEWSKNTVIWDAFTAASIEDIF